MKVFLFNSGAHLMQWSVCQISKKTEYTINKLYTSTTCIVHSLYDNQNVDSHTRTHAHTLTEIH